MKPYYLYVTYKAKPGMAEAFVRELEENGTADLIRAEDGCIKYDYYISATDKDAILLLECWESKEKQQIHIKQPHIANIFVAKEKYIIDAVLTEIN